MDRLKAAVVLVIAAWGFLFLQHILRVERLQGISSLIPMGVAVLGGSVLALSAAGRKVRISLYAVILLLLMAGITLRLSGRDPKELEQRWRKSETDLIASALSAIGEKVKQLADLSEYIGKETERFLTGSEAIQKGDSFAVRLEAFGILVSLADEITGSGKLPPGTEIGIQLFDRNGERIAWAGWPQPLSAVDHDLLASREEMVYTREVSLYRILTRIIHLHGLTGDERWAVVIDTPLEVNYKVNNRFLRSTSVAETIARSLAVNVKFDYYPPLLAPEDVRRRSRSPADTAVSAYRFPSYIEPLSEIAGDKSLGLSGRAMVKSPLGNPLIDVSVHGRPFRHFVDSYSLRLQTVAKGCLVLALVILSVLLMVWISRRFSGPIDFYRILAVVLLIGILRYALLAFQSSPAAGGFGFFDPAIFATPLFGGLLRSAGDMLITAAFLIIALYAVLKIARDRQSGGEGRLSQVQRGAFLWKGFLVAAALFLVIEAARRFVGMLVVNANPRLLGETMKVYESHVLILHLSTFLMLGGIFLAGMLFIWGTSRIKGEGDVGRAGSLGFFLVLVAALFFWRWEYAFVSALIVLFAVFAPRYARREDLVSIVIVSFVFVVIASGAAYLFLNEEYQSLRKSFIREKAEELAHPSDNWKIFILEDILEGFSEDPATHRALRRPAIETSQQLAFDLWAGSSLSLLGYSSAIYVLSPQDSVISRFAVDMPFRVRPSEETERTDTTPSQEWVVLDLSKDTPQGNVRFYRGIVNIEGFGGAEWGGVERMLLGKIVVDVPFSFENLAWAARTGPRTPELLRNVQEGSIEPRIEEPEALLLARLRGTRVLESSSDDLPAGISLPPEQLDKARELKWPLLKTHGGTYRYLIGETEDPDRLLLAGFRVPAPLWHILRWSTIFSLYLFFTVGIIIVTILLKQVPFLGSLLPTLTPGRRLGFQQKLLGSFLIVALLPAIILGGFSIRVIRDRFIEENKEEALYKAFSARKSLVNLLTGELDSYLNHADIGAVLSGRIARGEGVREGRRIRIMGETGEWLDAAVEPGDESAPLPVRTSPAREALRAGGMEGASGLDDTPISPEGIRLDWEGGVPYIGLLSSPVTVFDEAGSRTFYVYYSRRLDGDLLGEVADQVGADINIYDRGRLIASSREGFITGGFISPVMNADAFVKVSLMGVDHSLSTERAGGYRYQVAYLPLESSGVMERGALGLPLLFRPEPYHLEVQKATSIVLGVFALLFAATIGLGLFLARGIFEPLKGLIEGTKRIGRGELSFKLPFRQSDEIGTVVDAFNEMTDQLERSQRALEERRRYLEVILVNIGTGVLSTDEGDRIRTVNNAAERILGINADVAVGKTPDALIEEGVAPEFFSLLKRHGRGEEPFISSEVDVTKDGKKRTIKYMFTKLIFQGRYLGTVFVFEDLTELISSKKLSAWVEMARQIAHEIKNPLTPIKLSTQFMQRAHAEKSPDFDRIFRESSETVMHQVEVLKRIAGEFSSFGRMQQLSISSHKLLPLIEEIVSPYRRNPAGVEVSCDFSCDDLTVLADPEAFRKICTNLIENAMEAMPDGGRLEVVCNQVQIDGISYAKVIFRDTGPGLTEEVRGKLFEPYFSTKTTGTGLGLAICRTLSREMGGEITVENVPDGSGVEAIVMLKVG